MLLKKILNMQNNNIINVESIPQSDIKESSYKNFPKPEIIYKPRKKIALLPRIKKFKSKDNEIDKKNKSLDEYEPNKKKSKQREAISLTENKKLKLTKSINSLIIDTKNYPNLIPNSLSNNHNSKINNLILKSFLSASKNQNINKVQETDGNYSNIIITNQNIEKNNIFNISQDKANRLFRFNSLPKLKPQPLESIIDKININSIDRDSIFKSTEIFPAIKVGGRHETEGENTIQEEEKIEFNERLKFMMNKMSLKKNINRIAKDRNVYEILDALKKKRLSNCKKLIQKTSKEVQMFRKKMDKMYSDLKKSFDNEEKWNYKINFFESN
jgi:hypothetical protein